MLFGPFLSFKDHNPKNLYPLFLIQRFSCPLENGEEEKNAEKYAQKEKFCPVGSRGAGFSGLVRRFFEAPVNFRSKPLPMT